MQRFYPPAAEPPAGVEESDSEDDAGAAASHRAKPRRKAHQRPQVRIQQSALSAHARCYAINSSGMEFCRHTISVTHAHALVLMRPHGLSHLQPVKPSVLTRLPCLQTSICADRGLTRYDRPSQSARRGWC